MVLNYENSTALFKEIRISIIFLCICTFILSNLIFIISIILRDEALGNKLFN